MNGEAGLAIENVPPYDRRPVALGALAVLPDEIIDDIIRRLPVRDITSLACVSSVLNVFCSEEPLWMQLCMEQQQDGLLEYTVSWRHSALTRVANQKGCPMPELKPPLRFSGFTSMFLYRRWYRCHVGLDSFAADHGLIERRAGVSPEEFSALYDGRMPVMLTDLADSWPAKSGWSLEGLVARCGDVALRVTVAHGKAVKMRLREYAAYLERQHDEEPLYVFDEQFGEAAPTLLEDYAVPPHFQEDLLEALGARRPPHRWLIMGPARSGASWHVDPALTSAWNTLLVGRKRWAMYPPGRVPPGVAMHIDEETGEVHYECGTSLQWWLEVYPLLPPEERPLECTQGAGETLSMPSGWWHAVLNLEPTVAVTHNFVNAHNFDTVCLDMAAGFRHRGIARAGQLAAREAAKLDRERGAEGAEGGGEEGDWEEWDEAVDGEYGEDGTAGEVEEDGGSGDAHGSAGLVTAGQGLLSGTGEVGGEEGGGGGDPRVEIAWWADVQAMRGREVRNGLQGELSAQAAREYEKHGGTNGEVAEAELRHWLRCLWEARPDLQARIWQGACVALEAATWLERLTAICQQCSLPEPQGVERLPVGSGHNLVYLVGDCAIKVYVDGIGGDYSVRMLCRELELYRQIRAADSPLERAIPELVASGVVVRTETLGTCLALPWEGSGPEPDLKQVKGKVPAGTWLGSGRGALAAQRFESASESDSANGHERGRRRKPRDRGVVVGGWRGRKRQNKSTKVEEGSEKERWPYLVAKRCEGQDLKTLYSNLTPGDFQALAAFLGETLTHLHSLPLPEPDRLREILFDPEEEEEPGVDGESFSTPTDKIDMSGPGSEKGYSNGTHRHLEGRSQEGSPAQEGTNGQMAQAPVAVPEGRFQEDSVLQKGTNGHMILPPDVVPTDDDVAEGEDMSEEAANGKLSVEVAAVPMAWEPFVKMMRSHRAEIVDLLDAYDFIPKHLLPQVDAYLPEDPAVLAAPQVEGADWSQPAWLHTDPMDDNILLVPIQGSLPPANHSPVAVRPGESQPALTSKGTLSSVDAKKRSATGQSGEPAVFSNQSASLEEDNKVHEIGQSEDCVANGNHRGGDDSKPGGSGSLAGELPGGRMWEPSCLLDFGGVAVGDPLYDLACLHLSSFRCDPDLLRSFLQSYRVPLGASRLAVSPAAESEDPKGNVNRSTVGGPHDEDAAGPPQATANEAVTPGDQKTDSRLNHLSYRAMCYCLLHEHVSVRYIFKHREDLMMAKTLEEVEDAVWSILNSIAL